MIGESEARAILKGKIRTTQSIGDGILETQKRRVELCKKKSLNTAETISNERNDWYGNFLLYHKKFNKRASKYWHSEYMAIEPELGLLEGVGNICGFLFGIFDSKKFIKGSFDFCYQLQSHFYFHEHFLIRCIQRFGERSVSKIGWYIYPIIEWLVTENVPFSKFSDSNYFVFRDFIFVTKKTKGNIIIFITILLPEFMSQSQHNLFHNSFNILKDEKIQAVLVDHEGQIISKIHNATIKSFKNEINNSHWFQNILNKSEIRWDQSN